MSTPWDHPRSAAYGELYEVSPGTQIALTDKDDAYPWTAATPGAVDPHGLVSAEAADVEGWMTGQAWVAGTIVAHDGHDWRAAVDVPAQVLDGEVLVDAPEPGAQGDTNWDDLGARGSRLVIREGGAGVYAVRVAASYATSAAAIVTLAVHVNRVAAPNLASVATAGAAAISGIVVLEDGDVLDLHAQGNDDTETVTPSALNLSVFRIN